MSRLAGQPVLPKQDRFTILIVGEKDELPLSVRELVAAHDIETLHAANYRAACDPALLARAGVVLVCTHEDSNSTAFRHDMQLLADALASHRLTGVVLSPGTPGVVPGDDDAFLSAPLEASVDELWGRIVTIRQYSPRLHQMEQQVIGMQKLGKRLNQQFVEIDQELRLASRLQRDFLPKHLPVVGDLRFHVLYRPATWVSGDVYDVHRLDENYIGLYLADAVGHGVAAGLLTMFIKQAIVGKQIYQDGYVIVPPSDVLERLNSQLADQDLPNCQFVTACYATIDVRTYEIAIARGGHPHPIRVGVDGTCTEVRTLGGLLGIFHEEAFPSTHIILEPGEKLLIYSDGLEELILARPDHEGAEASFTPQFQAMARQGGADFLHAVEDHLNEVEGSLQPDDDMTLVVVERLSESC